MKIHQEFNTVSWSKGTSTELYIYPEGSSIQDRTFDIRISVATILEDSTFTKFEGFHRKFTLLEGHILLTHQNQQQKSIKPLESDEFSGAWTTISQGKGTAFNVIAKKNQQFRSEIIQFDQQILIDGRTSYNLIYVIDSSIIINGEKIKKGSLVEINRSEIQIKTHSSSHIICVQFEENN